MLQLTGSRFFNTATPSSDFDYFIEDSPCARAALEDNGFIQLYESIVPDANTRAVYQLNNIHIQLVKDYKAKCKIQELLKESPFGPLLRNKGFARAIWRFGFLCYESGKKAGSLL